MIRFWFRELMGWLLVLLGLYLFAICLAILLAPADPPAILEAPVVSVIGIVVFRGGIHLLKVAVAARICMQTQVEAKREPAATTKKSDSPWDW